LVFLLDTEADDLGIPPSALMDRQFGDRQEAFRSRVQTSGLVTASFATPAMLGQLVERALRELANERRLSNNEEQRGDLPGSGPLEAGRSAEQAGALDEAKNSEAALSHPPGGGDVPQMPSWSRSVQEVISYANALAGSRPVDTTILFYASLSYSHQSS